jgi:hypothetical protein
VTDDQLKPQPILPYATPPRKRVIPLRERTIDWLLWGVLIIILAGLAIATR